MSVGVNPPKTPVTEGSSGLAMATLPNVCKMPGPPAPFVPTPLPNLGKSDNSPQGYSTTVTIEGKAVAIKGATFNSTLDVASQGTGGGLESMNVQGPTSFIGPGSLDVTIEGKAVQLLSDQMLNNGGPSGSPANAATMGGILQNPAVAAAAKANPASENICGTGKHSETIEHPTVPEAEADPNARLAAMKALATTAEDQFEASAAEHNIKSGSITNGNQISRKTTPEESAAGFHPDDQKVMAVCSVCGYRREIDHAPDKKTTVEAKSTKAAVKGSDQMKNNEALVAGGGSVTYKAPPIQGQKLDALLAKGFSFIPIK
jgi:hypothetical protein